MGPAEPIMSSIMPSKDETLFHVPKLANDGSNWVVYKIRMKYAIASRGLTDYLEGTITAPGHPILTSMDEQKWTDKDREAMSEYESAFDNWNLREYLVRAQIAGSIEDSMLMKISHCDTAAEMWKSLCNQFEEKTRMVQVDLRKRMMQKKASEEDDIPAHLDSIRLLYEQLSGMGAMVDEGDYSSIIILSLPESYQLLLTTLGNAAQQARNPMTPDDYIIHATQEYERRHVHTEKSSTKDAAFSVSNRNAKNTGNGAGNSKKNIECQNCHKRGHNKSDCWSKGGDKAGQGPRWRRNSRRKGKAQAANTAANVEDGCWLATTEAFIDDLFDDGSLEELDDSLEELDDMCEKQLTVSSSSDEDYSTGYSKNQSSTFASIWDSEDDDSDETSPPFSPALNNSAEYTSIDVSAVALTESVRPGRILELYDSGATQHMTPYRHLLSNYTAISPKSINAANKHTFQAIGCGDLKISVPMDNEKASITLKNVLFAPDIGMTLISIGLVDRAGYSATFGNGVCTIRDKTKRIVGKIPFTDGLYRVEWDNREMTHTTNEVLTIMQLHACMGHIAPDVGKSLVKDGPITGIELDESSPIETCNSCTYGKLVRKHVPCE